MAWEKRHAKTGAVCLAYMAVVWAQALLGPTLLDFKIQTNSNDKQVATFIPSTYTGYAVGALAVTFFGHRINLQLTILACLILTVVTSAAIPWITSLLGVIGVIFAGGISAGIVESAVVAYVLHLWGDQSANFLQFIDFLFGLGSMLGPATSKPFLVPEDHVTNATISDLRLVYPFTIQAIFTLVAFVILLANYLSQRVDEAHPSRDRDEYHSDSQLTVTKQTKITIIVLTLIFFQFFSGMGVTLGTFIVSYGVKSSHNLSKAQSADIGTVSWAIYTFLGLASILAINKFGLKVTLVLETILITAGSLVLVSLGTNYVPGLWLGIILLSAGGASVFGALVAYLENIFPINVRTTSLILVSLCFGDIIWPYIVGTVIDEDPNVYIYTLAACGICCFITFTGIITVVERHEFKQKALDYHVQGDD